MSGRIYQNRSRTLIGALILVCLASCVKREPRGSAEKSAAQESKAPRERCTLRCQLKKQYEENQRADSASSSRSRRDQEPKRAGIEPRSRKEPERSSAPRGPGTYHTVKKGETLYRICRAYDADVNEVVRTNGISDPGSISVGQKIWIPGADETKKVDPAPSVSRSSSSSPNMPSRAKKGSLLFPVPGGKISSGFGMRGERMHEGVDILAPEGTEVLAADDGKVVYADDTIRGYGNMIIVKHAGDVSTVYAHNSKNLVEVGDLVKRGQKIAEVGMTGRASAPHVHFEVRVGEKPVDPMWYLP